MNGYVEMQDWRVRKNLPVALPPMMGPYIEVGCVRITAATPMPRLGEGLISAPII